MDPTIDGSPATILLWFMIYCFMGWVWESSYRSIRQRKLINSGFLFGPYIPIYGFGGLLYVAVMHFTLDPVKLFFVGATLACLLEYLTSWAMEKIFHARWWDYSDSPFNLNGRICLAGFVTFGLFAAVMPYVQLGVGVLVDAVPETWRIVMSVGFLLVVATDFANTVDSLMKLNHLLERVQKSLKKQTVQMAEFWTGIGRRQRWIGKRMLKVFPKFRSIKYPEAMKRIRKFYEESIKKKLRK